MRTASFSGSATLSALASLGMIALFTVAGLSAMPQHDRPSTWTFRLAKPDEAAEPSPAPLPVLIMRPDGATLRSGFALRERDGRIRMTLYDPADPLLIEASEGMLFSADLRVLWLLATDAERAELRRSLDALGVGMRAAANGILRSPEFVGEYRPILVEAGRAAVETAWRAPATRAAYEDMMYAVEPVLRDVALREVRPLLMKRLDGLIWEVIEANMGSFFDVFRTRPWNTAPIEQAIEATLRDVRELGVIERAAGTILETRQTKQFLQIFAGTVMDTLAADPRLEEALIRLATDPRVGAYLAPMGQPAADAARLAPKVLFGVRENTDLNALAAYTFNGFVNGRMGQVIILMSARQRDAMLRLDARAPRALLRSAEP